MNCVLLSACLSNRQTQGFGISTPTNLAPQMWSAGQSQEAKLNSNYRERLVSMNQIFSDSCSLIIGQDRLLPDLFYDLEVLRYSGIASSSLIQVTTGGSKNAVSCAILINFMLGVFNKPMGEAVA